LKEGRLIKYEQREVERERSTPSRCSWH
jgi:hypothetical protein